ncbi:rRNA maturation RNase YbeY [Acetobacteraceae bacterium]|nr:rRNA maturation RNase YbeY [Acetobacteraceae bacterium]
MLMKHMNDPKIKFSFSVEDQRWHRRISHLNSFVIFICRPIQRLENISPKTEEINVLFSNARTVKKLNYRFRNKNKSTNVLSFPTPSGLGGDIIISFEDVLRESQQQQKSFSSHMAHLLVHGTLHLFGYDHHHPSEAADMERLESLILSFSKISNPWQKTKIKVPSKVKNEFLCSLN